jgi:hypothetical protein
VFAGWTAYPNPFPNPQPLPPPTPAEISVVLTAQGSGKDPPPLPPALPSPYSSRPQHMALQFMIKLFHGSPGISPAWRPSASPATGRRAGGGCGRWGRLRPEYLSRQPYRLPAASGRINTFNNAKSQRPTMTKHPPDAGQSRPWSVSLHIYIWPAFFTFWPRKYTFWPDPLSFWPAATF